MTRLSLTFFSLFLVRNVDPLKQKQTCLYSVKRKKEKAGKKGEKKDECVDTRLIFVAS